MTSQYLEQPNRSYEQAIADCKRSQWRRNRDELPETYFLLLDYGQSGICFDETNLGTTHRNIANAAI
jgi:hypothetical protein